MVQFTASAELRDKLERLTALMPGNDLASIVEVAVTEKLDRLEAKRFGKTKKPRTSLEDADTSPGVRGSAAAVRRFVWERDGGQCLEAEQPLPTERWQVPQSWSADGKRMGVDLIFTIASITYRHTIAGM